MSSRQRRPVERATRRQTKRRPEKQQRRFCCSRTNVNGANRGGGGACSLISDKLAALKSLIPTQGSETLKSDQLFQETANYIVRLKAQVFLLQRLVDYYGSNENEDDQIDADVR